MEREATGPGFKMKGHTLPGINQKSEGNTDLADGRSKSSTFQQGMTSTMGATGNIAQGVMGVQPRNPNPPPIGGGAVVREYDPSVVRSKPSVAKIYDKPKGKRTNY